MGAFGPESFAFDSLGKGPYASLSDGRIVKWQGNRKGWTDFAVASPNRLQIGTAVGGHVITNRRSTFAGVHWVYASTKHTVICTLLMLTWDYLGWGPKVAWPPRS